MGFMDELMSGKAGLYGQWLGILSALLLLIFGIIAFLSNIIFCLIGFVFIPIILFTEIPFCLKICPFNEGFNNFMKTFENPIYRTLMYLVMTVVMWCSLSISTTTLIIPCLTLTATFICYAISAFKKEGRTTSSLTGGSGVVQAATSTMGGAVV
ncbi:hypothetical protein DFJ74DRAFT_681131 [Hyaloraphidium curvatum]|nr:hypothetical protein DFJ74DRAFT_681131 [Hyaloraphidium curvatum]